MKCVDTDWFVAQGCHLPTNFGLMLIVIDIWWHIGLYEFAQFQIKYVENFKKNFLPNTVGK